jgi:hypothetical protein
MASGPTGIIALVQPLGRRLTHCTQKHVRRRTPILLMLTIQLPLRHSWETEKVKSQISRYPHAYSQQAMACNGSGWIYFRHKKTRKIAGSFVLF